RPQATRALAETSELIASTSVIRSPPQEWVGISEYALTPESFEPCSARWCPQAASVAARRRHGDDARAIRRRRRGTRNARRRRRASAQPLPCVACPDIQFS